MKRKYLLGVAVLAWVVSWSVGRAAPVEFTARIAAVTTEGETTVLSMEVTPAVTIPVLVTALTEIKDQNGLPADAGALVPGVEIKVEGLFTASGVLALELELVGGQEFELKGQITAVDPAGAIELLGFTVFVPETARIQGPRGEPLSFSDLVAGMNVKVEGTTSGEDLVATHIKQLPADAAYARISFLGTIREMNPDAGTLLVRLEGDLDVLVQVTNETEIRGELSLGALVKVSGVISPELLVTAYRIQVVSLVRCSPDELHLGFGESAEVTVVLRQALTEDLVLALSSSHPDVAAPDSESLTIPAGELTATFLVTAGSAEGRTTIQVTLPDSYGGGGCAVKVEVEEDGDDDGGELEVRWSPRVIEAAPHEVRRVALHLSRPAPEELEVALSQTEGPDGLVRFPESVTFAAGRQVVHFVIEVLQEGRGSLEAALPEDLGGDTDTLKIDVKHPPMVKLKLHWRPDEVELAPGGEAPVMLVLERSVPEDVEVTIAAVGGDPTLFTGDPSLDALPMTVVFPAGSTELAFSFVAGDRAGRLKLRAALPRTYGGDHDDLSLKVEKDREGGKGKPDSSDDDHDDDDGEHDGGDDGDSGGSGDD
ncbi:MAG: hypothetical protein Kow00109_29590 [Acidobacteriota bacterium]